MEFQVSKALNTKGAPIFGDERLVGLELEFEGVVGITLDEPHQTQTVNYVTPKWQAVKDGSLRNSGAEFVSIPIPIGSVRAAVAELFSCFPSSKSWELSIRTGLHVHVDVRDFTLEQLRTLVMAYCLIEPALFNYVGSEREESVFCIPWYRAQQDCLTILGILDTKLLPQKCIQMIREPPLSKYDAVNWCPISKFGTIEFRHSPSSLSAVDIAKWAEICESIVSVAFKYSQAELLQAYLDDINSFPWRIVNSSLRPPNYERLMITTGAEWLANRTLKQDAPDPKNPTTWLRVNDRLSVIRPKKDLLSKKQSELAGLLAQGMTIDWSSQPLVATNEPSAIPFAAVNPNGQSTSDEWFPPNYTVYDSSDQHDDDEGE